MQCCRGENYFYLSLLWYPSLPALLNSFPLFPPPFPSTHLALTYNCCEPHRKHNGRPTVCVCVCVCHCESRGAFDPIKTSNLDGWKSLHTFLFLRSFAFLLLLIYIWLHSAVGDLQLSSTMWTEPTRREGNVLTIGFVKFGLRFLHRLARQTIRLRLRLCKSFSLLTWLMFYFKVKQQQTSFHRAGAFE